MQNDLNISDADGATFRADVNNAFQSTARMQDGPAAPTVTYPFQLWADTAAGLLKWRDAANAAWLVIGALGTAGFGILAQVTSALVFKLANAASALVEIGRIEPYISTTTAGAEAGGIKLYSKKAGAAVQQVDIGDGLVLGPATGGAPGAGGVNAKKFAIDGADLTTLQSLADAATIVWDAALGPIAVVTLGANRAIANASNTVAGKFYSLTVINGGAFTLTWGPNYAFAGGTPPVITAVAGKRDIFAFMSDGTKLYEVGRSQNL